MKTYTTTPRPERQPEITAFVESELESAQAPFKVNAQINVAVDEIFSNIAQYSGADELTVTCEAEEGRITLCFADNGAAYDPTGQTDPDVSLSAEQRELGGLGIYMVKKMMDRVSYEYSGGCNRLTIAKKW